VKKVALVSMPAKFVYWELYGEKFRELVKDPERCFRRLLGDEFTDAYEQQEKRLKAQGRVTTP